MSKFVKTAIAAAMVMGVFTSTATIAAGNNGTARFTAPLKTQCVLSFRTITNWKLIWVISVPKNWKITAPPRRKVSRFVCKIAYLILRKQWPLPLLVAFLLQIAAIITPFSIPIPVRHLTMLAAIGDSLGTSYKSGMGIDQKIVKDTSTNKGKAKQTLNFKARLVGAADAPDLGNFEANTTFQITYL